MIADAQQLQTTLQRIAWCETETAKMRKTEPNRASNVAAASGLLDEIKRLRKEVQEYFRAFRASRGSTLDLQDAIDLVRESLPASQADVVVEHLSLSVRIVYDVADSTADATCSHFGGVPLMPRGMEWPVWNKTAFLTEDIKRWDSRFQEAPHAIGLRDIALRKRQELSQPIVPLLFLGQLYLAEIHAIASLPDWPAEGSLAFFYEPSAADWDPLCRGHCRVLYFSDHEPLVPLAHHAGLSEKAKFPHRRLSFRKEWTLPTWIGTDLSVWGLENEGYKTVCKALMSIADERDPIHHCGGHPQAIQAIDMQLQCQSVTDGLSVQPGHEDPRRAAFEKNADDWRLLIQVDSDEKRLGWTWGDAGRIYFWARWQDIRSKEFAHSWAIKQDY